MPTNSYYINLSGTITEIGEQNVFTFDATAGDRISLDRISSGGNIRLVLLSPSGYTIDSSIYGDDGPYTLLETGTYQILVEDTSNSTGSYNYNLIKWNQAPTLSLGTSITGTLIPGRENDIYRFTATKGQRLQFDSTTATNGAYWSVYGPNGQQVGSNYNNTTDFTVTLPTAGEYYLVLEGYSNSNFSYSFQVNDISDTSVTPSGFGTTRTGTIAAAQTATFNYTGNAGQLIVFDSLDVDYDSIQVELRYSDNTSVFLSNASNDYNAFVLPRSGNYTVTVKGSSTTSTGDYSFRLLDLNSNSTALTIGTAETGTLANPSETKVFRFTGTVGQRLYFDALDVDYDNISALIVGPSGNTVLSENNVSYDRDLFTLTEAGTYYLVVKGTGTTGTPDYNFNLLTPPTTSVAFDTVTTANLAVQETQLYKFTGTAGQRLYFDSQTSSISANWSLYGPNNQYITSSYAGADFQTTLPNNGTYVLVVQGYNTTAANFNFQIITPTTTTNALTLNTPVSSTISELGEQDIYTFTGTAGQQLYYDNLKTDTSDNLRAYLVSPSGSTSFLNQDADSDRNLFTLTETGTYQLVIDSAYYSNNGYTGTYNFNLLTPPATNLAFDTVTAASLAPEETELYKFTGTAGQKLYFDSQTSTVSGYWSLRGADNQSISGASNSFNGDFQTTLPSDGTYVLVVQGSNSTAANFNFQIVTPTTTTSALTLNTPVSGTISELGEQDIYTFTGTAGQRLYYDSLKTDTSDIFSAYLVSPSGSISLLNQEADNDRDLFALTETGTYQLVISSNAYYNSYPYGDTGTYNFNLLTPPNSNLAFDIVTTVNLAPQETELYKFTGTAGQRLYFDSQTTGLSGYWSLRGTNNQVIGSAYNSLSSDFQVTLPNDGTYVLVVENYNTTAANFNFQIVTPTTTTSALTLNTPVSGTISELAEQDIYTFTGTAGQQLYYDNLKTDFSDNLRAYLVSPSGSTSLLNQDADSDRDLFILTETGTYQLVIDSAYYSNNGYTGTYNFNLLTPPSTNLAFDTVTTASLAPQETELYKFTGTAGQKLYFDSQTTGVSGSWYLYGPNNQYITGTSISSDFQQTLTANGTYVLVVDGSNSTAANFNFQVITPDTNSTALTLNTPVSGSISELGEQDIYTFTGTAGQRLYYDNLKTNTSDNLRAYLVSPSGNTIFNQDADSDRDLFTLTETGTYQLVIDSAYYSNNGYTGTYNFNLLDAGSSPVLPLGSAVTGTLTGGRETDIYRFTATKGQRLQFDSTTATNGAYWSVYGPNGQQVGSYYNNSTDFTVNLPSDGEYYLVLEGYSNSNFSYSFQVNDISDATVTPSGFGTTHTGTIAAAQTVTFNYTGNAGQFIYFDSLDVDYDSIQVEFRYVSETTPFYSSNASYDSTT